MKEVGMSPKDRTDVEIRVSLREAIGTDPAEINKVLAKLNEVAETIRVADRQLTTMLGEKQSASSFLRNACDVYEIAVRQAGEDIEEQMVKKYSALFPSFDPMMLLCEVKRKILEERTRSASATRFDAALLEEVMTEFMHDRQVISARELIRTAAQLLPDFRRHSQLRRGKEVVLALWPPQMGTRSGKSSHLEDPEVRYLIALEKLSRVALRADNPAEVRAWTTPETLKALHFPHMWSIPESSPLVRLRIDVDGRLTGTYETVRAAKKMAEILLNGKAARKLIRRYEIRHKNAEPEKLGREE